MPVSVHNKQRAQLLNSKRVLMTTTKNAKLLYMSRYCHDESRWGTTLREHVKPQQAPKLHV